MLAKKSSEELLLVSCSSPDPFSTVIVDTKSGSAVWGLKGHEFKSGNGCQSVSPLGKTGDFMLLTEKDDKWLHVISTNSKNRFNQVSNLIEPLEIMIVNAEGSMVFGSAGNKIYVWQVVDGTLLAIFEDHYQKITCMELSSDNALLVTASADGNVHVFNVSDIYCARESPMGRPVPIIEFRPHALAINGMAITKGDNPRIITVSEDNGCSIYSLSKKVILLKITADTPLKACAIDSCESRLFISNESGKIALIELFNRLNNNTEQLIVTLGTTPNVGMFEGHTATVTVLTLNTDGSMLASGDVEGNYRLWDIASKQPLRSANMKCAVKTMKFVPNWDSLSSSNYVMPKKKFSYFQRMVGALKENVVPVVECSAANEQGCIERSSFEDEILDYYYSNALKKGLASSKASSEKDSETIHGLRLEVERLKKELLILADQD
uniref:WD_REPEATS_REGION domain-containing protein n=1 Tax=Rhabditophanes sp. KR3021 TaxID=114890 RepID=A0AC35TKF9_9BILA